MSKTKRDTKRILKKNFSLMDNMSSAIKRKLGKGSGPSKVEEEKDYVEIENEDILKKLRARDSLEKKNNAFGRKLAKKLMQKKLGKTFSKKKASGIKKTLKKNKVSLSLDMARGKNSNLMDDMSSAIKRKLSKGSGPSKVGEKKSYRKYKSKDLERKIKARYSLEEKNNALGRKLAKKLMQKKIEKAKGKVFNEKKALREVSAELDKILRKK